MTTREGRKTSRLTNRLAEGLRESLSLGHLEREDFRTGEHREWSLLSKTLCHTHTIETEQKLELGHIFRGKLDFESNWQSRLGSQGLKPTNGLSQLQLSEQESSQILTLGQSFQFRAGHRSGWHDQQSFPHGSC